MIPRSNLGRHVWQSTGLPLPSPSVTYLDQAIKGAFDHTPLADPESRCYRRATVPPMILPYTEHRVGDGEKKIPLWLDDVPVLAVGLEEWPHVGDRFVILGQLWRVAEITDKVVCEREPS